MAQFHIVAGASDTPAKPVIRKINPADLKEALSRGFDDFWAMQSHLVFLGLIYPIVGISLAALTFINSALPLLYPLSTRPCAGWTPCRSWPLRDQPAPRAGFADIVARRS
jgi:uncharacterized membrane protein